MQSCALSLSLIRCWVMSLIPLWANKALNFEATLCTTFTTEKNVSDGKSASGGTSVATDLHLFVTQDCCNSCSLMPVHYVMIAKKQTCLVTKAMTPFITMRHDTNLTTGDAYAPFCCGEACHSYAEGMCCRQACPAKRIHVHLQAA